MATSQQTKISPAEKKRLDLNNWYQDLATQIMKSSQSGISRQAQVAAKTKLRDTYLGHTSMTQFELFFRAAVGDIVAHQELTLRKLEIEKLKEKIRKLEKTAVEDKQENPANSSENSDVEKVEAEADEAGGTTYFLHPKAGSIAQYKVQVPTQSSPEDLCHSRTPNGLSSIKETYEPDEKEEEMSSTFEKQSEPEENENPDTKTSAKRSKESKSKSGTPDDASLSSGSESESSSGSESENEEENYQTHIDESSDSSLNSEEVEKAVREMKKENKEDDVMTKLSEFLVSAGQEEGGELVSQMLTHVQSEIRKIRREEEEKNAVQEKIETEKKVPAKVEESRKKKRVKFEDEKKQSQESSSRKRKSDESQDSTEDEDISTTSHTIRNVSRLSRVVRARVSSSSDSSPSPPPNRRSTKYAETHKSVRILAKLTEDVKRMIQKGASYREVEKKLAEDFKRKYRGIEFKHYIQRIQRQSATQGYKNEHGYRRPHAHARQPGDIVDLRRIITSKLPRHYSNNYQKSYRPTRYPYPVEESSYYNSNRSNHESKYQSSSSSKNYIRKYEPSNYQAAVYSDSDYDTRVNRVYR